MINSKFSCGVFTKFYKLLNKFVVKKNQELDILKSVSSKSTIFKDNVRHFQTLLDEKLKMFLDLQNII